MRALFYLCALVVVASLVLGGGTQGGFVSDAILQLIAVPLLCLALWKLLDTPLTPQARVALAFCFTLAALPLLQLLPLPPWFWSSIPNEDLGMLDQAGGWRPISVVPQQTWLSALGLVAPLSIFFAMLLLNYRERRWLSLILIAVGTFSVFIGLLQVAQGPESPWRFFEVTNPTEAVGFFANRNHFAALGYALILFTAAWASNAAVVAGRAGDATRYDTASIVAAVGCFVLLVMLLAGEAMARSRAGLVLTIVALFGALAIGASDHRVSGRLTPSKLLVSATALAFVLAFQYALYRILERFEADPLDDARLSFIPTTIEAAKAYLPFGSGLGSFVPVYASFEKPEDALLNTYANHAHNDVAELFLEAGVFGVALVVLFVSWLAWRSFEVWRAAPRAEMRDLDLSLARAATMVVALILAHSFVDYPLRTGAMMAIMAFSCALLIEPLVGTEPVVEAQREPRRDHRLSHPQLSPVPALSRVTMPERTAKDSDPSSSRERWGSDIDWPEPWRKGPSPKPPS